jgi:hypothetical protein
MWIQQCSFVVLVLSLIVEIKGDCLFPEWKKTCQKYCMDNQLTDIQFNQCYSNQFKCHCNSKDLTETIKNLLQPTTIHASSTSVTMVESKDHISCVVNGTCVNGHTSCQTKYASCMCDNDQWIIHICPQGSVCKKDVSLASCQSATSMEDRSSSSVRTASTTNLCFAVLIVSLLMIVSRGNK